MPPSSPPHHSFLSFVTLLNFTSGRSPPCAYRRLTQKRGVIVDATREGDIPPPPSVWLISHFFAHVINSLRTARHAALSPIGGAGEGEGQKKKRKYFRKGKKGWGNNCRLAHLPLQHNVQEGSIKHPRISRTCARQY